MSFPELSELRPTRAVVSLDSLESNLEAIRARTEGRPILGVVKADAYGHGALPIARALQEAGIERLAVALLEEAAELRNGGITLPLHLLGGMEPAQADWVVRKDLVPAIFRVDQLEALDRAASQHGRVQPFHLKIDTGMGRLGIPWTEVTGFVDGLSRFPRLELEGVLSHLACADDPDHSLTQIQMDRFQKALSQIRDRGLDPDYCHLANSAAVLDRPPAWMSLVRPGLLLYGYRPSPRNQDLNIVPILSFSTQVLSIKTLPPGEGVGYGATFVARRPTRIAALAAGYDDGIARALSNRGQFLVRGQTAPIVGRISMDLTTLDVTDLPEVEVGDEAVFIGGQGDLFQGADQVAEAAGTITWDILCGIGPRVPRLYLRGGRMVEARSRFQGAENLISDEEE